ncbi:MAG: DUF2079 domain-containing protein [bacterium]
MLRYHVYRSGALDLGLYSQCIWSVLQGKLLWTSVVWGSSYFASHISPILFLFSPMYLIWNDPQMALIFQTIALAIGAFPIYWITKKIFKSDLSGLCFALCYLFYPGLQYANLFDLHPVVFATPFFLFALHYLFEKKYSLFLIFTLLTMMCREDVCLVTLIFGLCLFLSNYKKNKTEKNLGLFLFLFSFLWLFISFKFVIPYFWAQADSVYSKLEDTYLCRYNYLGSSYGEIVKNIFLHPFLVLKHLLTFSKIKHFMIIFSPLAFIPLLSIKNIIIIIPVLLMNFLSDDLTMYAVCFYHRICAFLPIVFMGLIEGLSFIKQKYKFEKLPIFVLAICIINNILFGPSPISLRFHPDKYIITKHHKKIDEISKLIPVNASVSASNKIGSHLSHREILYIFPMCWKNVDYIFVDLSTEEDREQQEKIIKDLIIKNEYKILVKQGDIFLLKRHSMSRHFMSGHSVRGVSK